jgi:hypothetical protein
VLDNEKAMSEENESYPVVVKWGNMEIKQRKVRGIRYGFDQKNMRWVRDDEKFLSKGTR